jgi:hypothetical protein
LFTYVGVQSQMALYPTFFIALRKHSKVKGNSSLLTILPLLSIKVNNILPSFEDE